MLSPTPPLALLFAQRLRAARCERGWSQRQLGRKLGLSPQTGSARINRYEQGSSPSLQALDQLAQVLDVPVTYFFTSDALDA